METRCSINSAAAVLRDGVGSDDRVTKIGWRGVDEVNRDIRRRRAAINLNGIVGIAEAQSRAAGNETGASDIAHYIGSAGGRTGGCSGRHCEGVRPSVQIAISVSQRAF